ncbi:Polyphosphate kinase [Tenacibaculum litopenaei]|uniref:polyphosphate kinase 1 n=1 Tax=Tenacibaculum litopenaei TaxID=396016 RepID=UPI0038944A59
MNKHLIHRDLSWVSFNERVLQEAENSTLPLYERLKFLAIFSSNLDEFYRVRISELRHFKGLQKDIRKKLHEKPKRVIKELQEKIFSLQERFGYTYREDLLPKLAAQGIRIINHEQYTEEQRKFLESYFANQVQEHIQVHYLDDLEVIDFYHDKELFLCLDSEVSILINIPTEHCDRFVVLPSEDSFVVTYLDEVIRANLGELYPDYAGNPAYSVKITRDGEMYFDEYEGTLVELIKENLIQRETGIPTRMLYDVAMPAALLKRLRKQLRLNKTDLMPGAKYHNFSDFFGFPSPKDHDHLQFPKLVSLAHPLLESAESLLDVISKTEVLLNFPYQKFDYIPAILQEAANSADVEHLYITLYRVSKRSAIAEALLTCLEKGKQVTVFIEAKARFDEANNIYWGEKLQKYGARVLYSMPSIKVHSKIFLIEGLNNSYGYIGTGNFNENSAKIYTDFALLTSSPQITSDLKQVFEFLGTPSIPPKISSLLMSPFTTRQALYDKIDREISEAKAGRKAIIRFKMNSLEDEGVIQKLYEASQAGVVIQLIVRGIFRLQPGVSGLSDNIEAISIVGRFLEHGRIYYFHNGGKEEVYIASADCMTRNLDKRVEIGVPILNPKLKKRLIDCFDLQWNDNVNARVLDTELQNNYQVNDLAINNAQESYYEYLLDLNKKLTTST